MQERGIDWATIRAENATAMSCSPTAHEISGGLRIERERDIKCIAGFTILGPVMAGALFVALATPPRAAAADSLPSQIAALQAQVTALQIAVGILQTNSLPALQDQVKSLQSQIGSLQTTNTTLQSEVASLQNQLNGAKNILALDPFVSVDPNPENGVRGPHITFSGVNIHLVSGSNATDDTGTPRGLGNLIIGYDEAPTDLAGEDREGSHNLVIGRFHKFTKTAFGGLVAGQQNTISNLASSVVGGSFNIASGFAASISGGGSSTPNVLGNIASGDLASVTGGGANTATGNGASVSGGFGSTASGKFASVTGGYGNIASGLYANVSAGQVNIASGEAASVIGGLGNTAGGLVTVVLGSGGIVNNQDETIRPEPPFN